MVWYKRNEYYITLHRKLTPRAVTLQDYKITTGKKPGNSQSECEYEKSFSDWLNNESIRTTWNDKQNFQISN